MIACQNICRIFTRILPTVVALTLTFASSGLLRAQSAATLAQVHKIYVEQFSGKRGAQEIRNEVMDRLKHDPALSLVGSAAQSDAVLKGNGEIWTTGYISNNPRASASSRSPVYSGYLSLTLEGGDAQPLWSYLVTPSGSVSGAITSNLAEHGAKVLLTAVATEKGSGAGAALNPSAKQAAAPGTALKGAGSTFVTPLYQAWIQSFHQIHPEIHATYEGIGSEQGIRRLVDRQIDFAGSDLPTSPPGVVLQRFATVLGAVVPIYNLPGLDRELRFTPEILAGIYMGKITRWDDPEIRAVNHGLRLPNAPIVVVHRTDEGSGTTYAFTDFLTKTCPAWKSAIGAGSTVTWPVGTGAARNDGVAELVQQTPNSMGYVELTYAIQRELSFGSVRNAAGVFVTASLESVSAAAQSAPTAEAALSITNAPGKAAYPITSFTWIVLPAPVPAGDRSAIAQMLQWMLTSGQKQSSALGYAPLPHGLANGELQSLGQLK